MATYTDEIQVRLYYLASKPLSYSCKPSSFASLNCNSLLLDALDFTNDFLRDSKFRHKCFNLNIDVPYSTKRTCKTHPLFIFGYL